MAKTLPAVILRTRPARFVLVGLYNTAVAYIAFAVLVLVLGDVLHYTVILVFTWLVGTLNAFLAYRVVVFRVRGRVLRDLVRFCSVYVAALGINLVALPLVVSFGLPVLAAQAVVFPAVTAFTYTAHERFSFRRPVGDGSALKPNDGDPSIGNAAGNARQ